MEQVNSADKELENEISERIDSCEHFHFVQSSKVSSISRNMIYGIVGTLWVLLYSPTDNKDAKSLCPVLLIALCGSFIYLVVDLVHYFWDACNYRSEAFRIDDQREKEGILFRHDEFMAIVSKRSFFIFVLKFIMSVLVSVLFVIGIVIQLKPFG